MGRFLAPWEVSLGCDGTLPDLVTRVAAFAEVMLRRVLVGLEWDTCVTGTKPS